MWNMPAVPTKPSKPAPMRHPDFNIGFTTDSGWEDDARRMASAAMHCPKRPWVRIVFDADIPAKEYRPGLEMIAREADVIGEPVDSYNFQHLTEDEYLERFREYVGELGDKVFLWEAGNEINGEWLADYRKDHDAGKKVSQTVVKTQEFIQGQGGKALVTYYLNQGCFQHGGNFVLTWMRSHPMPPPWLAGLSYYDDDCSGDLGLDRWQQYVESLAAQSKSDRVAITECGTAKRSQKMEFLSRYGGILRGVSHPKWCGGGMWWYGRQDFGAPAYNTTFAAFKKWFNV